MNEKEKELLQAKEDLQARMKAIGGNPVANSVELAKLVGEPYDPELAIADVISAVYNVDSVGIGEDFDYFIVDEDVKEVFAVVNGSVTQTNVDPLTENELTFSPYNTPEYYVYIEKLLRGKHSILAKKRVAIGEALDRIEQYHAINCIDTAVPVGNDLSLTSGKTKVDWPELVRMVRTVSRYAKPGNFVLITGANVTDDLITMDYDSDKNRAHTVADAGIKSWIPVEEQQVKIGGAATDIIDADVAYLVADSDSMERRAGYFVRQRVSALDNSGEKERLTISSGQLLNVGIARKMALSVLGFEMFGCVVVNSKVLVKLTK